MGDFITTASTSALPKYDVLIVGAGIAGSSLAHALANLPPRSSQSPLRIALLERSLAEPDRIVGELLQPSGRASLAKLGLESCTEGIDAAPVHGYCVCESQLGGDDVGKKPRTVHIPYNNSDKGRSFHHGKFIMALRAKALEAKNVDVVEATVNTLIECNDTGSVIGVKATRAGGEQMEVYAELVVIADGCFSNFRSKVMGKAGAKATTKSYFVGAVLEDAELPIPDHGTVVLTRGYGPVLFYRIGERDTRMLVDVKAPLPSDLSAHILQNVLPQMPPSLHQSMHAALSTQRLRRMPNSFLPPVKQGTSQTKEGVLLLGDAWNMRHPLTGGGMTVALNDVVMVRDMISEVHDLSDWREVRDVLHRWHWARKPLASTINILSVALYDLFEADDENLAVLREGCFKYFERGGECVSGPVAILSGMAPSPWLLFTHFFSVAFYSIWVLFTHARLVPGGEKPMYAVPTVDMYPELAVKSVRVFYTACVVFLPLIWSEIRWWAPASAE